MFLTTIAMIIIVVVVVIAFIITITFNNYCVASGCFSWFFSYSKTNRRNKHFFLPCVGHQSFTCEQVLFVYVFTVIPPRLTDPCSFITVLLVTREPEQTTLLFWSAACSVTPETGEWADWPSDTSLPVVCRWCSQKHTARNAGRGFNYAPSISAVPGV